MTTDLPTPAPLRVLHLTGTLDRGGVESWLVNVLAHVPRHEVAMDVLVVSPDPRPGEYAPQVEATGSRVFVAPSTRNPLAFAAAFLQVLRAHGPYDVVHSHIHHFGGLPLLLARLAGVPVRFSTSHLDTRREDTAARAGRLAYLTVMRAALAAGVTHRRAVSPESAAALYGPAWRSTGTRIVTLGIDLDGVRHPGDLSGLREQLGLRPGTPVIGHVGQFRAQKNHSLLLDIFAAFRAQHGLAQLLLVGDGAERPAIEARIRELDLGGDVVLAGSRGDVSRLLWVMDAFVFPSRFEGLGLALLEAQVAGLPCVVSDTVTGGAQLEGSWYRTCALSDPPAAWAHAVAQALHAGRHPAPGTAFDVAVRARELADEYRAARDGSR